jgi:hypothetical protein
VAAVPGTSAATGTPGVAVGVPVTGYALGTASAAFTLSTQPTYASLFAGQATTLASPGTSGATSSVTASSTALYYDLTFDAATISYGSYPIRIPPGAVTATKTVSAVVYTDIARDGVLKGLNIEATLALGHALSIPVIASGGLASLDDVRRLLEPDCAVLEGAITGRALYDGRLDPSQALGLIRAAAQADRQVLRA